MDISEQTVIINSHSMLPVGTLLQNGKYRIERYLSSGGFGNTYVATNTEFEEQVAIKEFFIRGITERDGNSVSVSVSNQDNVEQFTSQREKFKKEARRLRRLKNEHIVGVHDLFEENGTAYYEMDLIKGESLLERMKRTGQPLGEEEVLTILEQVLDALPIVHSEGLYHLDLKPANIMIDETGRALLIDFGASKQMSAGDGLSVSTSSTLSFTPGFAPLEQTEQNIKSFGPWTDLYALGATLYKLLTGLTPPSASEILMATMPLTFPTPVSAKTQQLITWMMKPRIDERPQNVNDIRRCLNITPKQNGSKSSWGTKRLWTTVTIAIVCIAGVIFCFLLFSYKIMTYSKSNDNYIETIEIPTRSPSSNANSFSTKRNKKVLPITVSEETSHVMNTDISNMIINSIDENNQRPTKHNNSSWYSQFIDYNMDLATQSRINENNRNANNFIRSNEAYAIEFENE